MNNNRVKVQVKANVNIPMMEYMGSKLSMSDKAGIEDDKEGDDGIKDEDLVYVVEDDEYVTEKTKGEKADLRKKDQCGIDCMSKMVRLKSKKINSKILDSPDQETRNVPLVGSYGQSAYCQCPGGNIFTVGKYDSLNYEIGNIRDFACHGGKLFEIPYTDFRGQGIKVECSPKKDMYKMAADNEKKIGIKTTSTVSVKKDDKEKKEETNVKPMIDDKNFKSCNNYPYAQDGVCGIVTKKGHKKFCNYGFKCKLFEKTKVGFCDKSNKKYELDEKYQFVDFEKLEEGKEKQKDDNDAKLADLKKNRILEITPSSKPADDIEFGEWDFTMPKHCTDKCASNQKSNNICGKKGSIDYFCGDKSLQCVKENIQIIIWSNNNDIPLIINQLDLQQRVDKDNLGIELTLKELKTKEEEVKKLLDNDEEKIRELEIRLKGILMFDEIELEKEDLDSEENL